MAEPIRGRYEPLSLAGRGGQGEVWRARDHQHDRIVALKVRALSGDAGRDALMSEARVLLDLKPHANLPLVREDFFEDGRYYMVIDWVEGKSLQTLLEERGDPGLPATTVLGYLAQVAEALDHLHAHSPPIVHQDVKPANLILREDGTVILVDFGISGTTDAAARAGTKGFVAPEVAAGERPTSASDVYSLAATAFTLLTGKAPAGLRPEWEGVAPKDAGVIERALRRALSTDPARRPGSAKDLLEQLRAWIEAALPTGTITFLFTDIEGSTGLLQRLGDRYADALTDHRRIVRGAIEESGGRELSTEGDSFFVVFETASAAVAAVVAAQRALAAHPWPAGESLRARMGLHTGEAEVRDGSYVGIDVHRAARIASAGHGAQVLLSDATRALIEGSLPDDVGLRDLGEHRLKDLARTERIHQLSIEGLSGEFAALRTLDPAKHNLPVQLTSFVGRGREMATVRELLGGARLLTLTAAGGAGKTRLALQVAAEIVGEYPHGVWLAELASLTDPALVAQAVAQAVGAREEPGQTVEQSLVEHCRKRTLLLVLDNCEHVVGACTDLAATLLAACADIRILATSREALGIPGEVTWRVPSLSLPDPTQVPTIEALTQFEAVRLFIDRARLGRPGFAVTNDNAPAVAQICHRLDGIPLAIELAAARVKMLAVEEISSGMDDRFRLLTGGSRAALARQRTLRAAVDWSYDLLEAPLPALFDRLSVFSSGFTLEAAEGICSGEGIEDADVLDLLAQLVDKSLVIAEERDGETRYRLPETIRQYAQDKLLDSGEQARARDRHLEWFLAFADRHREALDSSDWGEAADQLEREHDNLRAAMQWGLGGEKTPELAARLAVAAAGFWEHRGHLAEGRGWLDSALAIETLPPDVRLSLLKWARWIAMARYDLASELVFLGERLELARTVHDRQAEYESLRWIGIASSRMGDHPRARRAFEELLALSRSDGDRITEGRTLMALGVVASVERDFANAAALQQQGLEILRQLGDAEALADALEAASRTAMGGGDLDVAFRHADEAVAINPRRGPGEVGDALSLRAELLSQEGDLASARGLMEQALSIWRDLREKRRVAGTLSGLGELDRRTGDFEAARARHAEAISLWRELDNDVALGDSFHRLACVALDERRFDEARAGFGDALAMGRKLGDARMQGNSLSGLVDVARMTGAFAEADGLAREALARYWEARRLHGVPNYLEALAATAARLGRAARAARIFGAAAALRDRFRVPRDRWEFETRLYAEDLETARAGLPAEEFERAWAEGASMSVEEAIEYALGSD